MFDLYLLNYYIIEVNLCVFCLLVLVLKVMGYFIVKLVVKIVVGLILDEMFNFIIGILYVVFELILDYVIFKILCFLFDKFEKGECEFGI